MIVARVRRRPVFAVAVAAAVAAFVFAALSLAFGTTRATAEGEAIPTRWLDANGNEVSRPLCAGNPDQDGNGWYHARVPAGNIEVSLYGGGGGGGGSGIATIATDQNKGTGGSAGHVVATFDFATPQTIAMKIGCGGGGGAFSESGGKENGAAGAPGVGFSSGGIGGGGTTKSATNQSGGGGGGGSTAVCIGETSCIKLLAIAGGGGGGGGVGCGVTTGGYGGYGNNGAATGPSSESYSSAPGGAASGPGFGGGGGGSDGKGKVTDATGPAWGGGGGGGTGAPGSTNESGSDVSTSGGGGAANGEGGGKGKVSGNVGAAPSVNGTGGAGAAGVTDATQYTSKASSGGGGAGFAGGGSGDSASCTNTTDGGIGAGGGGAGSSWVNGAYTSGSPSFVAETANINSTSCSSKELLGNGGNQAQGVGGGDTGAGGEGFPTETKDTKGDGYAGCPGGANLSAAGGSGLPPTPPTQPTTGPGGSSTPWGGVNIVRHTVGEKEKEDYWTVEPKEWKGGGSAPTEVPSLVYLHGFGAWNIDIGSEEAFATHLAEEGNYVIYPQYQNDLLTNTGPEYTPATVASIKYFLAEAHTGAVKPDLSLGMTVFGYSAGGMVAANIASEAAADGFPEVKGLMLRAPWDGIDDIYHYHALDASLAGIPANVKMDCLVTDEDSEFVGRTGCDAIWERTPQLTSRDYIWMFGDGHGSPPLEAKHVIEPWNALVWYGALKLSDAVADCGIYGTYCEYAQGGGPSETSMGSWSDGVPVKPLSVYTTVPPCPKNSSAIGCGLWGAPTAVSAQSGEASVTAKWTAPTTWTGTSTATYATEYPPEGPTGYTVTATPEGGGTPITHTFSSPATSETLEGLSNGTAYSISVAAVNSVGTGQAGSASNNPVTPEGRPTAPQAVTASAGEGSVTARWSAPASNGGSTIMGYTVTATPEGGGTLISHTFNSTATTETLEGLTNGTPYDISVAAVNSVGTGPAAEASDNPVTPATKPTAPQAVTASAGEGSVTARWSAPASNGGSTIMGYTVTATPEGGGTLISHTFNSTATTETLEGLTNGTPYDISVAAVNGVGTGPAAEASDNPSTPAANPGAPTLSAGATPNNTGVFTLEWSGPNPLAYVGLTYTLQHENHSGTWTTVASGIEALSYEFDAPEEEGTWVYRVQGSDPSHGLTTEYSSASTPIVVDETPPNAPNAKASRAPDYAGGGGWYKDSVEVSFASNGDPNLSDESPGSGVNPASVPASETFSTSGSHTAEGTVEDNAGNVSAASKLTVQVDATPPRLEISCPASVEVGSSASASYTASDAYSGLSSAPSGTVPIDTGSPGEQTVSSTAVSNVGLETTESCTTEVEEEIPTPGAPTLSAGTTPNNNGLFTLSWSGDNPLEYFGLSYTLQQESHNGTWTTVASGIEALSYEFDAPETEGTWTYRVEGSDPGKNMTTAWSSTSSPVVVDETAPLAPSASAGTPTYSGDGGWFKNTATVTFSANGDPNLSDGSAGSGVNESTLTTPKTYTESGSHKACGTVSDNAGNLSAEGCTTVQVDSTPPSLEISCPAMVSVGASGVDATISASDSYSGLEADPSGTVPINTSKAGPQTTTETAVSNVGLETTKSCTTEVGFTEVISGSLTRKLVVKSGQAIELTATAKVAAVQVQAGGTLVIEGASSKAISATGATLLRICAATITGALKATGSSGSVVIGEGSSECSVNTITSGATVKDNRAGILIDRNVFEKALSVKENADGATVTNNKVTGNLTVTANTGTVLDRPNEVKGKSKLQ